MSAARSRWSPTSTTRGPPGPGPAVWLVRAARTAWPPCLKCSAGVSQPTPDHNEVWTLVLGRRFDSQDLRERRAADLELALVRLARPDDALDLEARAAQRAGQARLRVALAPREHLDRHRGGGERDGATRDRAGPLEDPAEQQRAGDVG